MTIKMNRTYPRGLAYEGGEVELRMMTPADEKAVLEFAKRVSPHDMLFLRRDITQPKVVAAWMETTAGDTMLTLLAWRGGQVVGCTTLVRDPLSWSSHVGELRIIIDPSLRGVGLGQKLTLECFAIALDIGLEKLVAQMTVDQRGAIAVFEGLGFRAEALLHDHVKDREGKTHDIVVLSHDVAKVDAQMRAYGMDGALE